MCNDFNQWLLKHTCCTKPTSSWVRSSYNEEKKKNMLGQTAAVCHMTLWPSPVSAGVQPYHLKEPPQQEAHAHPRRAREVELIAERGGKHKIIHV